jgi:drug/metabolite transporter (DMT)-like permease
VISSNKGALFAALSGLFYGLIGYFGLSVMNANISAATMLFWRFFISSLAILVLIAFNTNKEKTSFAEVFKVFFYGMAFYATTSLLYFISAKYIGSGLAMVVFYTYPALIMIINYVLYQHRVNKIYYFALTVLFVGMLFLVEGSQIQFNVMGISIGLLSALLYALYIVASKNSRVAPLLSGFYISFGSAFTCLITACIDHSFTIPTQFETLCNLLGIGIVCTALPIVLLLKGLKQISSLKASILSVLEPVFVVFFGVVLLGETINLLQGIGVVVILSGALLTLLNKQNEPPLMRQLAEEKVV